MHISTQPGLAMRNLSLVLSALLPLAGLACSGSAIIDLPDDSRGGSGQGAGIPGKGGAATGGNQQGSCDCPVASYVAVCGTDNQTYNVGCGEHCVPVEIACQGECPCRSCRQIAKAYVEKLAEAQVCNLEFNPGECNVRVDSALECGCPTMANSAKTGAIAELQLLKEAWRGQNCEISIFCPDEPCPVVVGGHCQSDTPTWHCVGQYQ